MTIKGLLCGMLMLAIGGFFTLGVATALERRAEQPESMAVDAQPAHVAAPNVANGPDKSSDSHWMF